jgi:hypothetical protein
MYQSNSDNSGMNYKYQWTFGKKTYRFTKFSDKIERYDIGRKIYTDDEFIDETYSFHRIGFGIYVLSNNWLRASECECATMKPRVYKKN